MSVVGAGLVIPLSAQETAAPVAGTTQNAPNQAVAPVYPIPQQMKMTGGAITVDGLAIDACPDEATLAALKEALPLQDNAAPIKMRAFPVKMKIGGGDLPNKEGAYSLRVSKDGITMQGHDDVGLFYAAQTLIQLAKKMPEGLVIPQVEIKDWPDIPFRGSIEGFYGLPWGQQGRISQFKFYGKYKLNTYVYGPKDDVFHGFSNRWREPYPADKAAELKELVKIAKQNKVNFIWAVHPGADVSWGEADRQACVKKFEMMYELGFRSFAVFFDDVGGTGAQPEGQVEFLNYVNKEFIHKKKDVTPLIMCPTAYSGRGGHYHDVMGAKLDKDIGIMWTGDTIVSDIRTDSLKSLNSHIKRPAFIWWNFPVTDYVRHALFLGRCYGVDKDSLGHMQGFASNPMDKPEASKIALFSVANLCWNAKTFDSEKTWKDSIRIMFPNCADAMQTLANHNSDGGPSVHNYRREESKEIAPTIEKLLTMCRNGEKVSGTPEFARVKAEFEKIRRAGSTIRREVNNPALLEEIEPWLVQFDSLGAAGVASLNMIEQQEAGNENKATKYALKTAAILVEKQRYSKEISEAINKHVTEVTKKHSPWQKSVAPSELVIAPAVRELLDMGSTPVLSHVAGRQVARVKPYVSTSAKDGIEKMLDKDPNSFFYCKEVQKKGDYFGVDLGATQEIRTVHLLQGRRDGDTDCVNKGQLEASVDGKKWKPLMPETTGTTIDYKGQGVQGRFVRYRATVTGIPGGKPDVWTAIRDFKVNAPAEPAVSTDVADYKTAQVEKTDESIALKRIMEVKKLAPKKYIGILIPAGAEVENVKVNLKTPDLKWAKLYITQDGKKWSGVAMDDRGVAQIGKNIKGARLVNVSKNAKDVTLEEFRLKTVGDADAGVVGDMNLQTYLPVKLSATQTEIPCHPQADCFTLLTDGKAEVTVSVYDGTGRWRELGKMKKGVQVSNWDIKPAPKPVKIGLSGKDGETVNVFEVIL